MQNRRFVVTRYPPLAIKQRMHKRRSKTARLIWGDTSCAIDFKLTAGAPLSQKEWKRLANALKVLPTVGFLTSTADRQTRYFSVDSTPNIRTDKQMEEFYRQVERMVEALLGDVIQRP